MTDHSGILFGSAYYAEYQPTRDVDRDLDLMAAAGFTVIRVGESVWSTWEPRDGEFDLDWIVPVLDGARRRGISVILGTPTYAIPPWLKTAHPELAVRAADGSAVPWGGRQDVDFTAPVFRAHAERVIRAILGRHAGHPAIIGFQVDNEPGVQQLHNDGVFARFLVWLEERYGTPERLTAEWGLTYWSHRLTAWNQVWRPEGNTFPQYDLAWRRFQADLTTEFIGWQAGIVRQYAGPKFVTTCIAYLRDTAKDADLAGVLDVTAGNPYYAAQHHLHYSRDVPATDDWVSSGVPALLRQADRMYSSRQERFLVTETNVHSIAGSDFHQPPFPGQLRQVALALVARGASMIEYWHWQALHWGTETYWGGVLPHSSVPGRAYAEVAQIGADLRALGARLDGYVPDADVLHLWSDDSRYALEFSPPYRDAAGRPDRHAYREIFDAFHRGATDAGLQSRIVHDTQLADLDPSAAAHRHRAITVPGAYLLEEETAAWLEAFAAAGGHVLLGIRSGYADREARPHRALAPGPLAALAGVGYEEFSTLAEPLAVEAVDGFALTPGATARHWVDGLVPDDAEAVLTYRHPFFGRYPALTTRAQGAGRVSYLGTVPDRALARDVFAWAVPAGGAVDVARGPEVTVLTGRTGAGERIVVVHNWSPDPSHAGVAGPATDALTGAEVAGLIPLEPWSCRVLVAT